MSPLMLIPASDWPHTHDLERVATGISKVVILIIDTVYMIKGSKLLFYNSLFGVNKLIEVRF
jgi:hypothetical protein